MASEPTPPVDPKVLLSSAKPKMAEGEPGSASDRPKTEPAESSPSLPDVIPPLDLKDSFKDSREYPNGIPKDSRMMPFLLSFW